MDITTIERTWEFTHDGRKWTLPRPTLGAVEVPYLRHLKQLIADGIDSMYRPSSPQYRLQHELLQKTFTNGTWKWNSERFRESLNDEANFRLFVLLWFRQVDQGVTEQMVDEFMEVTEEGVDDEGVPVQRSTVLRIVLEMLNDPNRSRPPLTGAAASQTTANSSAS